jgi:hypothetical protein
MFRMDDNAQLMQALRDGFAQGKVFYEERLSEQKERIQSLENAMLAIMAVVGLPPDERTNRDIKLIVTGALSKEGGDANEG